MKHGKLIIISILTISSFISYSQVNRELFDERDTTPKPMINNHNKQALTLANQTQINKWRVTDDGVMGGRSRGYLTLKKGYGLFTGEVSLANNGGFTSIFTPINQLSLETKQISIDIEGDGQLYQLRLVAYINGYRLSYNTEIETLKNVRQSITVPFSVFQAGFRGRMIKNAPNLSPEVIREVGFLINKKQAGSFSLAIFKIEFI